MTEIPVLFCFDDRILLGAGVSILSMLDSAADETVYAVHIFHPGFSSDIRAGLEELVAGTRHSMTFHEIAPERFDGVPKNKGSWTEIVYYRLLAPEVLGDLDKAIYSDVDVLVKRDLGGAYGVDLEGYDWAGVAAEGNTPDNVTHRHFPENTKDTIYFSGFMVMNLKRMRETGAVKRYFEVIETVGPRLKFFDLDILNIASDAIYRLPFDYVVLEDIFETEDVTASRDWEYLKSVYSRAELEAAREDPAIVHFAGRRGKPWQRRVVPAYYREVVARLPRALRRQTFRDWRKRWIGAKGRRKYSWRSPL
ncbi:glycosyltransferase family 8 protein [Marinibacterium profundimaris]|uniref:glycosyltransferase family 8 protein n=1 Tax=Marinibacterium profundimaris TaxID=1679460 RepID=UPI0013035B8C|nr:glycosyltransferase family 8 protein [Marinibacterium profundimaris]